ncbi:MAG: hypothetical protein HN952_07005 [Candidatus Cloacimonetes bacterium]|jgi:hypothetical protein|nr:hypothetical protein [Candidatus Cloacimonadota bacterium]MBT6994682.1 hypothetical protein [Candidatus Cloacimonadota bacterium]MBT7469496.1 hypothetical protein [Candidatus Cloacimonadota bacterium]
MSKKIILILLMISLAFNIAVFLKIGMHIAENKMNCEMMEGCDSIQQNVMEKILPLRKDFHKSRRNFMQMVINPQISDEEILRKLDEMLNIQIEMERKLGENIIEMRKEMSSSELRKFLRMRKNREMRMKK